MTSMSSLEFDRDAGKAQQLAEDGPVFITDHGKASYVLLSIDQYKKLASQNRSQADSPAVGERIDIAPSKTGDVNDRLVEFD